MAMKPNFNVTPEERALVDKIVARAVEMYPDVDTVSLAMDIVATHNHICKLRLAELLAADDFNFAHDVTGIIYHLDRQNLTMNRFLPRFAAKS